MQQTDTATKTTTPRTRRLLFISHSTPEDNAFATWLATQLAIAGYEVWCDSTNLLGGERFWDDITEAIDAHAFRFLFASTTDSNRKRGTLRELEIALDAQRNHRLRDFIVPLKVDQLPFASAHASIRDLNFVRFDQNWAAGLAQLINLLEREAAPRSPTAGPACVTQWHRRSLDSTRQVVVTNDRCFANWFRLSLPKHLWFHSYAGSEAQLHRAASGFTRPCRTYRSYLVTFADADELQEQRELVAALRDSMRLPTTRFLRNGHESPNLAAFEASNIVTDLVRQAWDAAMLHRKLRSHTLASGMAAWFFKEGQLPKNKAYFQTERLRLGRRRPVFRSRSDNSMLCQAATWPGLLDQARHHLTRAIAVASTSGQMR